MTLYGSCAFEHACLYTWNVLISKPADTFYVLLDVILDICFLLLFNVTPMQSRFFLQLMQCMDDLFTCSVALSAVVAAELTSWSLILFGTASRPQYLADYLSSKYPTTARVGERSLTSISRHSSSSDTAAQHRNVSITAESTVTHSTESTSAGTSE